MVVDIGTTCTKAGYAGEDCPKFVLPSSVGVVGGEEGAANEAPAAGGSSSGAKGQYFVGTNALSVRRDGMRVAGVMRDGIVADWDAYESLLEHTLKTALSSNPAEHPLLLAEPNLNPPAHREKMAELAFEKMGVPALFLSKNAVSTSPCVSLCLPVSPCTSLYGVWHRCSPPSPPAAARPSCSTWAAASPRPPPCTTATSSADR